MWFKLDCEICQLCLIQHIIHLLRTTVFYKMTCTQWLWTAYTVYGVHWSQPFIYSCIWCTTSRHECVSIVFAFAEEKTTKKSQTLTNAIVSAVCVVWHILLCFYNWFEWSTARVLSLHLYSSHPRIRRIDWLLILVFRFNTAQCTLSISIIHHHHRGMPMHIILSSAGTDFFLWSPKIEYPHCI